MPSKSHRKKQPPKQQTSPFTLRLRPTKVPRHTSFITVVKYSPAPHTYVAIGDDDGTLTIHVAETMSIWRHKTTPKGKPFGIRAIAWNPVSPDEILIGFNNGELIGYKLALDIDDVDHMDTPANFRNHLSGGPIQDIVFNENGSQMAVIHGSQVSIMEYIGFGKANSRWLRNLPEEADPVSLLYYDINTLMIVCLTYQPAVLMYYPNVSEMKWTFRTSTIRATKAALSPDRGMFAILDPCGTLLLYTLPGKGQPKLLSKLPLSEGHPGEDCYAADLEFTDRKTLVLATQAHGILIVSTKSSSLALSSFPKSIPRSCKFLRLDVARLPDGKWHVVIGNGDPKSKTGAVFHFIAYSTLSLKLWNYVYFMFAAVCVAGMAWVYAETQMDTMAPSLGPLASYLPPLPLSIKPYLPALLSFNGLRRESPVAESSHDHVVADSSSVNSSSSEPPSGPSSSSAPPLSSSSTPPLSSVSSPLSAASLLDSVGDRAPPPTFLSSDSAVEEAETLDVSGLISTATSHSSLQSQAIVAQSEETVDTTKPVLDNSTSTVPFSSPLVDIPTITVTVTTPDAIASTLTVTSTDIVTTTDTITTAHTVTASRTDTAYHTVTAYIEKPAPLHGWPWGWGGALSLCLLVLALLSPLWHYYGPSSRSAAAAAVTLDGADDDVGDTPSARTSDDSGDVVPDAQRDYPESPNETSQTLD